MPAAPRNVTYISLVLERLERHALPYRDEDTGRVYLTLPERLPHDDTDEPATYVCRGHENLLDIAVLHYRKFYAHPADLWQVIAEFQEEPIIDPFTPPPQGRVILVPSPSYIEEVGYGEPLTDTPEF